MADSSPLLEREVVVLRQFFEFAASEPEYRDDIYHFGLPIPLPAEEALSAIWPAVEASMPAGLDILEPDITEKNADALLVYAFRMASHALRLRSPEPAVWALCALALGTCQLEQREVKWCMVPACHALRQLGISHHDFLARAARLTRVGATPEFLAYLKKPEYPGDIAEQFIDLVETEDGPRYVAVV